MKNFILAWCVFLVAAISGCASNEVRVRFVSDPPGATLYEGQKNVGRAPIMLAYAINDEDRSRGKKTVQGITAIWVSGAKISYQTLNIGINGYDQEIIFTRPAATPGRDKDMNYALELEKLQMMNRQAEAQERAAYEASRAANAQQNQSRARSAPRAPVTCTRLDKDIATCY